MSLATIDPSRNGTDGCSSSGWTREPRPRFAGAVAQPAGEASPGTGYAPHAFDPEAARTLWQLSEELVGERLSGGGRA